MITYRDANMDDAALVLDFIQKLAEYEKLAHECIADINGIKEGLFGQTPKAFCIIAEKDNKPAGFAICFYNYSTFLAKAGIYIEDLFVEPEFRGQGIGSGFFQYLSDKAERENCGRVQWQVLDWNKPSIEFYNTMGGKAQPEWITYKLEGDAIKKVAKG